MTMLPAPMQPNEFVTYTSDLLGRGYAELIGSNAQLSRTLEFVSVGGMASARFIESVEHLMVFLACPSEVASRDDELKAILYEALLHGRTALQAADRVLADLTMLMTDEDEACIGSENVPPASYVMLCYYSRLLLIRQELQSALEIQAVSKVDSAILTARLQSMIDGANRNLCVATEALLGAKQIFAQTKKFVDRLEATGLFT